jgi:DNA-binding transcriptional LysR family regulator
MDLDLARVRAFVAVADEGHFGRAAQALGISQQALSKRVARLEAELGTRLLVRGAHGGAHGDALTAAARTGAALTGAALTGAALTEVGRRFLAPARQVLAAGEVAVAAARAEERPLRLDVWGHLFAPMRTVAQVLEDAPGIDAELGSGRDLPAVAGAVARGEIDAGFGRVYPGPGDGLAHRLVRLEPVDAILPAGHVLAGRDALRPADLRDSTLVFPAAAERLDFLTRFADRFGITERSIGANLGLEHFLDRVRADPGSFSLLPADVPLPDGAFRGVRVIPLIDPTPLYAWSLLWRPAGHHPRLPALLDAFARTGRRRRWLEFRPGPDWLPDPDKEDI